MKKSQEDLIVQVSSSIAEIQKKLNENKNVLGDRRNYFVDEFEKIRAEVAGGEKNISESSDLTKTEKKAKQERALINSDSKLQKMMKVLDSAIANAPTQKVTVIDRVASRLSSAMTRRSSIASEPQKDSQGPSAEAKSPVAKLRSDESRASGSWRRASIAGDTQKVEGEMASKRASQVDAASSPKASPPPVTRQPTSENVKAEADSMLKKIYEVDAASSSKASPPQVTRQPTSENVKAEADSILNEIYKEDKQSDASASPKSPPAKLQKQDTKEELKEELDNILKGIYKDEDTNEKVASNAPLKEAGKQEEKEPVRAQSRDSVAKPAGGWTRASVRNAAKEPEPDTANKPATIRPK